MEAGQCWAACLGLVAGQFYVFVNLESITMVEPVITEGSSAIEGSSSFKSTPRHPIIRGSAWVVLVLSVVSWFWGAAAVWTKYTRPVDTPEAQIDGQLGRPREKSLGGAGSSRWGTAQPEPIVGVQDRERSVTQTANAARGLGRALVHISGKYPEEMLLLVSTSGVLVSLFALRAPRQVRSVRWTS